MERLKRAAASARGALFGRQADHASAEEAAAAKAKAARGYDCARTYGNVLAFVLQLAASQANLLTGTGQGIGGAYATGGPLATLVQPVGWAFAIWGPIYALQAAYVVWQALPDNAESALARRAGWFTLGAFVLLGVWGALASAAPVPDSLGVQVALLVCMLLLLRCAWLALRVVATYSEPLTAAEQWCVAAPLSLLAGWLTLAAALNAAVVALLAGASCLAVGAANVAPAALLVIALGVLGCVLAFTSRANPVFGAAYIWGLVGIAVANASPAAAGVAAAASISAAAVLAALLTAMCTVPGEPRWGWPSAAAMQARDAGAAALESCRARWGGDCTAAVGACCARCGSLFGCACKPEAGQDELLLGGKRKRPGRLLRIWRYLYEDDATGGAGAGHSHA
jgi:hypothetical protein